MISISFKFKIHSKQMPTRKWLAKHGLSAQKLTILDALSPTFIPHQPKYVPIINKHVMSKVFDDVGVALWARHSELTSHFS